MKCGKKVKWQKILNSIYEKEDICVFLSGLIYICTYFPSDSRSEVEDTLNRIRSGEYVTRPEWEDLYTSMAKPSDNQPVQPMV